MAHAVIDINSTSLQLLIVSEEGKILSDITRDIGLQLELRQSTLLSAERIQQILEVLNEMVEVARLHNIPAGQIRTVATMELRRALNAKRLGDKIFDTTGLQLQILTDEEEARLFWRGGLHEMSINSGSVALINLGAGSCSAYLGEDERILHQQNINMGCVRLTEEYFGNSIDRYDINAVSDLRAALLKRSERIQWPVRPKALIGIGPTISALSAVELGLPKHNPSRLHGSRFSRGMLRGWIDRLLESTAESRRALCPAYPERVDYLMTTALILETICTASFRDSIFVSAGGVRIGVIIESFIYNQNSH